MTNQTHSDKRFFVHFGVGSELIEVADVHNLVLSPKDVREPTLRQTLDNGHLPTFKTTTDMTALTSLLTFVTTTSRLTVTRTGALPFTLA